MKIDINKVKIIPNNIGNWGFCIFGEPDTELEKWIECWGLKSEISGKFTNIYPTDSFNVCEAFDKPNTFKYVDGFSPNLNKHLHIGHVSNLVIANALQHMDIGEKFIAILGNTLNGVVTKDDALVEYDKICKTFDYKVPSYLEEVIEIGQRVKVPFGPRLIMGYVLGLKETSEFEKLKNVVQILDLEPSLTKELLDLGKILAMSNTSPLVSIYQAMLPKALKSKYKKKLVCKDTTLLDLDLALKFNKFNEVIYDDALKPYFKEIKKQINVGNIIIKYEVKQANNEQYIKKIKLLDENIVLRGNKQKAIVKYLLNNDDCLKSILLIFLTWTDSKFFYRIR